MEQKAVPWVLIRLDQSILGIDSGSVREMLQLPRVTAIPQASAAVRGVVTLRDHATPVIDLRKLLGMPSLADDSAQLIQLLSARAEDHRKWLAELDASVKEDRTFGLTLDPHACAFGRWYDQFKATSVVLESHLKRFDRPHQQIHALGHTVTDLVSRKQHAEASALIEEAHHGTLATLMQLFEETPKILAEMNREMLIVLKGNNAVVSVTADAVESVEPIRYDTIIDVQLPNGQRATGPVAQTARTARTDSLILILDAEKLLAEFSRSPARRLDCTPAVAA